MDISSVSANFLFKEKGPILESISPMGIVNITPDSFSDGTGELGTELISQRIEHLINQNINYIDIGAQSTAPSNPSIGEEEELKRWREFGFKALEKSIKEINLLSVDTYWPCVFKEVYQYFKDSHSDLKIVWNDVSGILDQETFSVLKECPSAHYVFCHSHAPSRDKVNEHLDYVEDTKPADMAKEVMNYFKDADIKLSKHGLQDRTYFDFAFGFSKTLEQNYALLKDLWWVVKKFPFERPWIVGISRKSFLQKMVGEHIQEDTTYNFAQSLEQTLIFHWMNQLSKYNLTFRMHAPEHFQLAKETYRKVVS